MSSNYQCDHARSLMSEAFSSELLISNLDLKRHLESCSSCQKEFDEILSALGEIEKIQIQNPVPPANLWDNLEKRILVTEQEKPSPGLFDFSAKQLLIAQYSYITTLGIGLWLSLFYGQPVLNELVRSFGLPSPEWFFSEYTLFIIFFSFGGFSAIVAAPILVQACLSDGNIRNSGLWDKLWKGFQPGEPREGGRMARFFRLLHGNLRLFAC